MVNSSPHTVTISTIKLNYANISITIGPIILNFLVKNPIKLKRKKRKRKRKNNGRTNAVLAGLGTAIFSVLECNVLLHYFSSFWRLMRPERTMHSFLKNVKEHKERNILLQRT